MFKDEEYIIRKNKNLKYNHVVPIDLDNIPKDEIKLALKEFSEGSFGLETCLSIMWKNNLKTKACCAGEYGDYDEAYILMDEKVDLFRYLSEDLLNNDMVAIEKIYDKQRISFCGTIDEKEQLLKELANCIMSGKKNHDQLVQKKLKKGYSNIYLQKKRKIISR